MHRSHARALVQLSLALIAIGLGGMLLSGAADTPAAPAIHTHQPTAVARPARAAPATRDAVFAHGCPPNDTLTLAGTALIDGGRRIALIRTPSTARLVTEGQPIEGHIVQAIARRAVAVTRGDQRTCLKRRRATSTATSAVSSEASPVRATGPGAYAIDRRWLRSRLDNLKALSKDIRVIPVRKGGKLQGFRVSRVRSGGVFSKLGLARGDVLLAANGQPLDSPNRILKLYAQLPDSDVVRLRVQRGSGTQTLDYAIE